MSLSKRLYRESALERLSSPEQLDQQLTVTSPRGWLALLAIWVLLGAIVLWSVMFSLPIKEEGQGIIVVGGGLKVVVSPGTGRLDEISFGVKEAIEVGDVVARIDKQEIREELDEVNRQLQEMRRQHEQLDNLDRQEEQRQAELEREEKRQLQEIIEYAQKRLGRLNKYRDVVDRLIREQGALPPIKLDEVDEQIETTLLDGQKAQLDIEQLETRNTDARFQREREALKRKQQREDLQGKLEMLEDRLARESDVVSHVAGRIVEVRAALHSAVNVGDPILLVEPAAGELEAILYVSAATGKRIEPEAEAYVSPGTVKPEEHGSLRGQVSFVADTPTSRQAMEVVLSDKDQVDRLMQQVGGPLETRVKLRRAETPSGLEWSSGEGPLTKISASTPCHGTVTVERRRPIELLVPYLRKKLGAD